jgi:uncharacterized membrane protein YesL
MRPALDVFWETLRDWYNGMVGLAALNFVWLAASLTVILLPPITAGLCAVTNSLAHGMGAHFSDLWPETRRYAWVSYRWALANVAAVAVFVVGFTFYGNAGGALGIAIQALFATGGLVWLAMQLYVWPFLIEQEDKRLRPALKNALFLALANPIYTFIMLGATGLALLLSVITLLPIAVFATSFISLLGNRAVIERLTAYGKLPGAPATSSGEE